MCKTSREPIDHLFLHCMVATELWSTILHLFGVVWVMPRSVKDMLERWRERNARCFEDCEIGLMNLKKLVMQTLFMWREKLQSMSCSYSESLDRCSIFSLN
jgi:hypothetical protein